MKKSVVCALVLALFMAATASASAESTNTGTVEELIGRFAHRSDVAWELCNEAPASYVPDVLLGIDLTDPQIEQVEHLLGDELASTSDHPYDITAFRLTHDHALAARDELVGKTGLPLELDHIFFYNPFHRYSPAVAPTATDGSSELKSIGHTARPVVVIDTGFPETSPKPDQYRLGYNSRTTVTAGSPTANHGPFIASQIAALTPGDITLQRVLNEQGLMDPPMPGDEEIFDEISLLATLHTAKLDDAIVNFSFGTYGCAQASRPAATRHALEFEHEKNGAEFVSAAGNDETKTPHYPAAFAADYDWVVSVGAHQGRPLQASYPKRACFSNFGTITTWAPGVDVAGFLPGMASTEVAQGSGTSFASPYVTAAIAAGYGIHEADLGLFPIVADYHGRGSKDGTTCS